MTTTTAVTSPAVTAVIDEREPLRLRKRIGSTTFIINVRTSPSATETAAEKLRRLIESEVRKLA